MQVRFPDCRNRFFIIVFLNTQDGATSLYVVCSRGYTHIATLLIQYQCDINKPNRKVICKHTFCWGY